MKATGAPGVSDPDRRIDPRLTPTSLLFLSAWIPGRSSRMIHKGQIPRAAQNFRFFAERALEVMDGGSYPVDDDFHQLQHADPRRCCGPDHAVEHSSDDGELEACPCNRLRKYSGAQAC